MNRKHFFLHHYSITIHINYQHSEIENRESPVTAHLDFHMENHSVCVLNQCMVNVISYKIKKVKVLLVGL